MGELRIIGREGDAKVEWEVGDVGSVGVAERVFEDNRKAGYLAFRIYGEDGQGEMIDAFDKDAKRILLIPPIEGG